MKDYLDDAEMAERVTEFLASGENPHGQYVSAKTLFKVIDEVKGVRAETRKQVIEALREIVVPGEFVDSFKMGMTFGKIMIATPDIKGVTTIAQDAKNLDKVPIINVRGTPVI